MHALIVANGRPPSKTLLERESAQADVVIAADGGGNTCLSLGLTPDVIVGDMDSFEGNEPDGVRIIRDSGQETNDLEKALEFAILEGVTSAHVLGATGMRLDHALKNLSVMSRFSTRLASLRFFDDSGWIKVLPRDWFIELSPGTTVSLFPLSGRVDGIVTHGLQWALNDEFLENGVRDGTSNRVVSSPVQIRHRSGILLIFVNESVRES